MDMVKEMKLEISALSMVISVMVPTKEQNLSPMYSRLKSLNLRQCADVSKQKILPTAMVHMPIYNLKNTINERPKVILSRFFSFNLKWRVLSEISNV